MLTFEKITMRRIEPSGYTISGEKRQCFINIEQSVSTFFFINIKQHAYAGSSGIIVPLLPLFTRAAYLNHVYSSSY